jgi:AcrR family transcriptional regulator
MRADAARNRARVLAAAREAFADHGLGVPVDDIARAAGVGAGTVYRHFPTKESLYEAILLEHVETLAETARTYALSDRPGEAFYEFLKGFAGRGSGSRPMADALVSAGVDVDERLAGGKERLVSAIGALLGSAQAAGAVRGDVSVEDLFALLGAVHGAVLQSGDDSRAAHLLAIVADGLRPP